MSHTDFCVLFAILWNDMNYQVWSWWIMPRGLGMTCYDIQADMLDDGWIYICYVLDGYWHVEMVFSCEQMQVWFMIWNTSVIYDKKYKYDIHVMNFKYDMLWVPSMIWHEYQAWYVLLQELSCTSIMIHVALDIKGLSTDYSRHCTYYGTDWRSI